ncbi:MAG: ABC transporter substrate-binding protein [Pseudomonadota bacterium]
MTTKQRPDAGKSHGRSTSAFAPKCTALWLAALLSLGVTLAEAETPTRVVSMNLCTDQLAMMLAAPGQLISVSSIAHDPFTSPMHIEAQAYPTNYGSAEEIFLLAPDLVLAGSYSNPTTIAMLRRLRLRVEQIDLVEDLSQVATRLREVGEILDRTAEAEAAVDVFEARLEELRAPVPGGPLTAFYYPNGYTLGTETLSHEILSAAGIPHLAERLGRAFSGRLALEELVMADPAMIITSDPYPAASRSEEILRHPAMRRLTEPHGAFVAGNEWICGTPHVLAALEELAHERAARQ